ncbi:MAG: diheme cytochrome c-553 [Candidatus Zixiibacteriota bacterium]
MQKRFVILCMLAVSLIGLLLLSIPALQAEEGNTSGDKNLTARGEYLNKIGDCGACHSPKIFTATGPMEDTSRYLSGHPADEALPEMPDGILGPTSWGYMANNGNTAFFGPWGVSFGINLTPDPTTGIGHWTEEQFIKAMREGKHRGMGRPVLPPMPRSHMTDDDLKALFAYYQSLKPVENKVPSPIPPANK